MENKKSDKWNPEEFYEFYRSTRPVKKDSQLWKVRIIVSDRDTDDTQEPKPIKQNDPPYA